MRPDDHGQQHAPDGLIDCPADYTVDADAACTAVTYDAGCGQWGHGLSQRQLRRGRHGHTVSYSDLHTAICEGIAFELRTWTASATDDCNNSASATCDQTITVNDNTPRR